MRTDKKKKYSSQENKPPLQKYTKTINTKPFIRPKFYYMNSYEQCFNIVTKILFVYPHQRVQFQFLICQLSVTYSLVFHSSLNLCVFCATSPRVRPLVLCWHLLAPPGITPQALLAQHMCERRGERHSPGDTREVAEDILELLLFQLAESWEFWEDDDGASIHPSPPWRQTGITEMSGTVSTWCCQCF